MKLMTIRRCIPFINKFVHYIIDKYINHIPRLVHQVPKSDNEINFF